MTESPRLSLIEHLGEIADPRIARTQRHELLDILVIALCAVIGGADHWTEVVGFGQAKRQWFSSFLKLSNGIPSHDTFARVFRLINPEALEQASQQWLRSIVGRVKGVVAIDGKSVRGARDGKKHPLHIVSACLSGAPGPRASESGLPAAHGADPAQAGDKQEAGHSRQAPARRLG